MLDQITAQTETRPPVPIGAQFMGRARDLRRRVEREDTAYDAAVNQLIDPVMSRLRRHPARSVRPETLADLVNQWHSLSCSEWRLSCAGELEKHRCAVVDRRLSAGKLQHKGWNGDGEEDIGVIEVALLIDRNRLHLRTRCLCTISLHAIGRRLQRHPDGTDEALLHDIGLAGEAASGELVAGAGYKIATDPQTGSGWRGRVIRQRQPGGEAYPVLSIRTWL